MTNQPFFALRVRAVPSLTMSVAGAAILLAVAALLSGDVVGKARGPRRSASATEGRAAGTTRSSVDRLPSTLAPVVMQTLQSESDASYGVVATSTASGGDPVTSFEAPNVAHAFTTRFDTRGLTIHPDAPSRQPLALRLATYGSSETSPTIAMQDWTADGLRVERKSADPARPLVEWYMNGRLGLEQGFTVAAPPDGRGETLALEISVGDGWTARSSRGTSIGSESPRTASSGDETILLDEIDGPGRLRYGHLSVVDAGGTTLPASMAAERGRIVVRVETAGARYPVTIDPFVQQAQLTAIDGLANDHFGISVAVDGDTAVMGANQTSSSPGSAYVFVRSGGTWTLQAKLTASPAVASGQFGTGVAVSGDTIVVGAFASSAAYVFVRSGTTWSQQAKLTVTDAFNNPRFGANVALSGNTAVISAHGDDLAATGQPGQVIDAGSAYVFARSGTTWSQQAKLKAGDPEVSDLFGSTLSVSGDTVVVGAPQPFAAVRKGKAYVFVRSGTTWSQQQKLTASDGVSPDRFGTSVSASGDTAVVGATGNANQGAAYVFVRSVGIWSELQKLTAGDGAVNDQFGISVAVSGDAAVIGADRDDVGAVVDQGSAYLFTRSGTTWTQNSKLTASDGAAADEFGFAVALSGTTAVVGANLDDVGANSNQGSAYVFLYSSNTAPTISPASAITRQQGSPAGAFVQIASVSDADQSAGSLIVTASPPAGISVTGISNASGVITAIVSADCSATAGANTVQLTVADSGGLSATANLTIDVTANTPPTLGSYPAVTVNVGDSATVMPSVAPADNGSINIASASAPGFSGVLSVDLAGGVTVSNAGPAGSYTVTVTLWDNCGAGTSRTFNLTVNKRTPTITWNAPADVVYGTALSATQLNATATVPGAFVYVPAAGTVLDVGTHALTATFTPTDQTNYNSVVIPTPALVRNAGASTLVDGIVVASGWPAGQGNTQAFSTTNDLAYQGNGFAQPSVTKDALSCCDPIHRGQNANDGKYGNGASWIGTTANSWVKIDLGRVVTIGRVTLGRDRTGVFNDRDPGRFTISVATSDDVYANGDEANDATEYQQVFDSQTFSYDGLVNGAETIEADFSPVTARYLKIMVANVGADIDEVEVFAPTNSIVVTAAPLTITASSGTKAYGTTATTTASYSGFVIGETSADLSAVPTCTSAGSAATAAASPTAYATTCSGAAGANYSITYVDGVLTVTTVPVTATLSAADKTYDGTPAEPDASLSCALTGVLAADSANVSCAATSGAFDNANAGARTVAATVTIGGTAAGNYTLGAAGTTTASSSQTAAATITVKAASVTPAAAGKTYGAAESALTGTLTGFLTADAVTATYSRAAGETAGTYAISATLEPAAVLGNYDINYVSAAFTITPADLTVTANDKTRADTAPNPPFDGTVIGLVPGDGITATYGATSSPVPGTYPIVPTLEDPHGRLGNYHATIVNGTLTVTDTQPPIVTVPADITAEATSAAGAIVTFTVSALDLADGPVGVACTPASGATFALGTTTVSCVAQDHVGNTGGNTFMVTVQDTTAPSLTVPGPDDPTVTVIANDPGGAPVDFAVGVTASDLVGVDSLVCTPTSGSLFAIASTPVSCAARDAAGNITSRTFTVHVLDGVPPTILVTVPPPAEATLASGAAVSFAATASDNIDEMLTPTCVPASGTVFPLGDTTVTCTAEDATHNPGSASFTVTVIDTTPPSLTVPTVVTGTVLSGTQVAVSYAASALDIVDGSVTPVCTPASGSLFAIGDTPVTCTATDGHGNASTRTITVRVNDGVAPLVTVDPAGDRTVEATSAAGAVVTFGAAASDNTNEALTATCVPVSGSTFPLGTASVTCAATDAGGNTGRTTFTVTVGDTTPPALALPAPLSATAYVEAGVAVSFSATAADLVNGSVGVTCAPASGSTFAPGQTTVNCSATDSRGNASSGIVTVSVTLAENRIGKFVAFSRDSTLLRANAKILTGDIGANERRRHAHRHEGDDTDEGDGDDMTVRVGERATMAQPASRVVGDTVRLLNRSSVYNVLDNVLINKRGTILGSVSSPMAIPYLALPAFPAVTAGTTAKTVAKNQTLTLGPGSYGAVNVSHGATLVLTGGLYQMRSLDVDQSATVVFRGATEIRITTELDTNAKAKLVLDQNVPGLKASQMVIYVEGTDAACLHTDRDDDGDDNGPAAVHIGQQNVVQANIYAKNGTVWLRSKTQATGSFIGEHVRVGQNVTLTIDSAFK